MFPSHLALSLVLYLTHLFLSALSVSYVRRLPNPLVLYISVCSHSCVFPLVCNLHLSCHIFHSFVSALSILSAYSTSPVTCIFLLYFPLLSSALPSCPVSDPTHFCVHPPSCLSSSPVFSIYLFSILCVPLVCFISFPTFLFYPVCATIPLYYKFSPSLFWSVSPPP